MGLDCSFDVVQRCECGRPHGTEELFYWRKYYALDEWMKKQEGYSEYKVTLTPELLGRLQEDLDNELLAEVKSTLSNEYHYYQGRLNEAIYAAQNELVRGNTVIYRGW